MNIPRRIFAGIFLVLLCTCAVGADTESAERKAKWESYFYPGVKALETGDYTKAEQLLQQALTEIAPLGPTAAAAGTASNLGIVYEHQGKFESARAMFQSAVTISQKARGNLHPDVAMDLHNLARVESKLKNYDRALQWLTQAIHIMRETGNGRKPATKIMLEAFADNFEKKGDSENAKKARDLLKEIKWEQ